MRRALLAIGLAFFGACAVREPTPAHPQLGPTGGYAPRDFDFDSACRDWDLATNDPDAKKHVAFPEHEPRACFVEVFYDPRTAAIEKVGPAPAGCGYPEAGTRERLAARADAYERVAADPSLSKIDRVPLELACALSPATRRAAALANARTLRSYAASIGPGDIAAHPYALASTFGYGQGVQNASKLLPWAPGAPCVELTEADLRLLSVNVVRAGRAADAYENGVAPLVSVSGGAVHAKLVEAFMLGHLVQCLGGVPSDRILYDPCADHTHTNVRNTGALVTGIGGRTAYVVTDDFIQSDYLQDWTAFDLIGGSVDQRALRDFGYVLGAYRQASRGIDAGFWLTPYRFFAEPREGRGSFTCVGDWRR